MRWIPSKERILTLIADDRTNKGVGDDLQLAEKTVKNYVSSILSKLEVACRAEAAAYLARRTGDLRLGRVGAWIRVPSGLRVPGRAAPPANVRP